MSTPSNRMLKAMEYQAEERAFAFACQPPHARKLEQHTREWFVACDLAFQRAMFLTPSERPTGHTVYNAAGGSA